MSDRDLITPGGSPPGTYTVRASQHDGIVCPSCPPADQPPGETIVRRLAVALSDPTLPECAAMGHYERQARRVLDAHLNDPALVYATSHMSRRDYTARLEAAYARGRNEGHREGWAEGYAFGYCGRRSPLEPARPHPARRPQHGRSV